MEFLDAVVITLTAFTFTFVGTFIGEKLALKNKTAGTIIVDRSKPNSDVVRLEIDNLDMLLENSCLNFAVEVIGGRDKYVSFYAIAERKEDDDERSY